MIRFDSNTHTYWNQNNVEYIAVTKLIEREYPFDVLGIANKVTKIATSKYFGMSVDRIVGLWESSSDHGNVVHDAIEDYIKKAIWPSDNSLIPIVKQFSKLNFKGTLQSEVLLWDDDYRIAGTADILECFDNYIYLFDIKTSNKIDDNKLCKFSLQLEIYRRLIEKCLKKHAKIGGILWFEDYVKKRSNTKLKLLTPLKLNDIVDDMLKKRKDEL